MLIVTLPPNWVFTPLDDDPQEEFPSEFKATEHDRMAFYWWISEGRFSVQWRMQQREKVNIDAECQRLNEEARKRTPRHGGAVHLDRPPEEVNTPSYRPSVTNQPPVQHLWVVNRDQARLVIGKDETYVKQEKVVNIGNNAQVSAPITIADSIESSFNTLNQSATDGETKQLLQELLTRINEVSKHVSPEQSKAASEMAEAAEILVKEVARAEPRRRWYEFSVGGIRDAAKALGEIAEPVLDIVTKLMPIILP
jgi:hypothetical protein